MSVKLPVAACMWAAFDISAQDLREPARGLQVGIERIEGTVEVNGLPLLIARATGNEVQILANRLVEKWRLESGKDSIRLIDCCGWHFASRLHTGTSQVVQWRLDGGGELMWSSTELRDPVRSTPAPRTPLGTDCAWSTPTSGSVAQREFLQMTANCAFDSRRALDLIARRMADEGWKLQRIGHGSLQATLGDLQAQLIAGPAPWTGRPPRTASSLVLIESRPATASRR